MKQKAKLSEGKKNAFLKLVNINMTSFMIQMCNFDKVEAN